MVLKELKASMARKKQQTAPLAMVVVIALIVGAIAGAASSVALGGMVVSEKSQDQLIKEFYDVETAVMVSPHGLRKAMAKGDDSFVLIDLRSQEEYEEEHIIGAVSVPAYRDRDHSDYGAVERIVSSVRVIQEKNPGKDLIVYCYSIPCMTGRKVGKILSDHGIYVKELGIGWNEWKYFWTLWNHPHEWNQTNPEDWTWSGPDPGVVEVDLTGSGCPIEGGLGC